MRDQVFGSQYLSNQYLLGFISITVDISSLFTCGLMIIATARGINVSAINSVIAITLSALLSYKWKYCDVWCKALASY